MCKNILVVGGPSNFVFGNLSRKLADHGIEIGWHVSDFNGEGSPFTKIPSGCDGVVVLTDMASHPLYHKVSAATKEAGIPLGRIPRKWSVAEGMLRAQGILNAVSTDAPKGNVTRPIIKEMALAYIIGERRAGRNPKWGEVEGAIQRALGPSVKLFKDEYSRAKRMAANQTPLIKPRTLAAPQDMTKEIYDWAMFFIEEDPSQVHDVDNLLKLVSQHSEVRFTNARVTVEEVVQSTKERWASREDEDRTFRDRMIVGWLRGWFKKWDKTRQDYPDFRSIILRGKEIFGITVPRSVIKQARSEALGEWAAELVHLSHVQEYADATYPELGLNVSALVKAGKIKSIPTGKMPMTSAIALDEFVKNPPAPSLTVSPDPPKLVSAPDPEPEPPEPEPVPEVEVPVVVPAPEPVRSSDEDILTLASIVEDAITKKLTELLSPIHARLDAIERQLEKNNVQVDMSTLLDRVLNGSEVTGITVSIDPTSLRKKPQQEG